MNRVEEYLELHKKLEENDIKGIIIQHNYTGEKDIKNSLYFTMSAMEIIIIFQIFKGDTNKINEEIQRRNLEPVLIQIIDALKKVADKMEIKLIKLANVIEFDDDDSTIELI